MTFKNKCYICNVVKVNGPAATGNNKYLTFKIMTTVTTFASYNLSEIFSNAWATVRQAKIQFSDALRAAWAAAKSAVKKLAISAEKIAELSIPELESLKAAIDATLGAKKAEQAEQEPEKPQQVLFNPDDHFERYNGGWSKEVKGLDKSYTNGYSIEGDFMQKGRKTWFIVGKLYLDCGIGGSRKNQRKVYNLYTVDAEGAPQIIQTETGSDWATNLWDAIESYL